MVSRDLTPYMDMYSGYDIFFNGIHSGRVDLISRSLQARYFLSPVSFESGRWLHKARSKWDLPYLVREERYIPSKMLCKFIVIIIIILYYFMSIFKGLRQPKLLFRLQNNFFGW